ncbi:helix-turn-helix domain-containing protein [Catellatospora methionotrophica]|uniref:helix-turn-helix domain-containing protein n=1 Tax=Catellatospora methionotrophica TaxID=121620 RepID=UPI0033E3C62A
MTSVGAGNDATFGEGVRRLRRAAGMSLTDLALRASYSRSYLSKLENRIALPNSGVARTLDRALGAEGLLMALAEPDLARKERRRRGQRAVTPFTLPAAPTAFHGRRAQLETIVTTLSGAGARDGTVPAIVVCGIAGIGKTALAVTAAHDLARRFPDGCLFVDLHGYTPERGAVIEEVLDDFLRLLGVDGDEIPAGAGPRVSLYRSILRDRQVLVVIDNACHSDQVRHLIPSGGGCAALVTSRDPLPSLNAAGTVRIGPLDEHAAVALLGSHPDDQQPALRRIAEICAGFPLALRIAAGLLAHHQVAPGRLLTELTVAGRPSEVLQDGERSIDSTLTVALSCLTPLQRTTLALVSLHPGPALTAEAVAWLAGRHAVPVEAVLAQLHGDGLLLTDASGGYTFHDLVRPHAVDLAHRELDEREREQALRRLVDGYVHAAHAASAALAPQRRRPDIDQRTPQHQVTFEDNQVAYAWCAREVAGIVALGALAHRQGWHTACWQLAYSMRDFYFLARALDPWTSSHRLAVEAAERDAYPWAYPATCNNLGLALVEQGDIKGGLDWYAIAMDAFTRLEDRVGQAVTLGHQAWAVYCLGRHRDGVLLGRRALKLYESTSDVRGRAITLRTLAVISAQLPDEDPVGMLTEALGLFDGLSLDAAMTLNCLGEVYRDQAGLLRAAHYFARAVRVARSCESGYEQARGLAGLASVARLAGHPDMAEALLLVAQNVDPQSRPQAKDGPRPPGARG